VEYTCRVARLYAVKVHVALDYTLYTGCVKSCIYSCGLAIADAVMVSVGAEHAAGALHLVGALHLH
jgi:hypothetical protein